MAAKTNKEINKAQNYDGSRAKPSSRMILTIKKIKTKHRIPLKTEAQVKLKAGELSAGYVRKISSSDHFPHPCTAGKLPFSYPGKGPF